MHITINVMEWWFRQHNYIGWLGLEQHRQGFQWGPCSKNQDHSSLGLEQPLIFGFTWDMNNSLGERPGFVCDLQKCTMAGLFPGYRAGLFEGLYWPSSDLMRYRWLTNEMIIKSEETCDITSVSDYTRHFIRKDICQSCSICGEH